MTKRLHKLINLQVTFIIMIILIIIVKILDDDIDHPPDLLISPQAGHKSTSLGPTWSSRPSSTKHQDVGIKIQHFKCKTRFHSQGMILNGFKKIIFQNRYVALETPSRPPPPFMAKTILNFHFDYLIPSLRTGVLLKKLVGWWWWWISSRSGWL